ncbi:MAG: hypothetical protein IPM85_01580 [Chitinophagaceae bacterium]|nr:hypothetical protein [Chitinophagaceae bacterium]
MNDTPQHIKERQLKIWMSKKPEERLLLFLQQNEEMWMAIRDAKIKMKKSAIKHDRTKLNLP